MRIMRYNKYISSVKCTFPKTRRNIRYLAKNPNLDYIETHLVDHCNLNCRGCAHFAPLATPWFADVSSYNNDMKRLSKIFTNINKIRLLGGEPLLHKHIIEFLSVTRNYFPYSHIVLVTNGLLLEKMNEYFWDCCRNNGITITTTVYPPMEGKREHTTRLLKEKKVRAIFHKTIKFISHYNLKGDSNPVKAFKACRSSFYAPFLREGKIYACSLSALAHIINHKFGTQIPTNNYIDIYSRDYSRKEIIQSLNRPSSACRFCSTYRPEYPWARSNFIQEEWDDTNSV